MVSWMAFVPVTPGRYSTVAFSVARLTDARTTPGIAVNPVSILATHEAQDMPSIGIVRDEVLLVGAGATALGRIGVRPTICTGGVLMPRGPPRRTAAGSASKVRLQPGAQK
jgi:hypothetical protein